MASKIEKIQDGRHSPYILSEGKKCREGLYDLTSLYLGASPDIVLTKCGWHYMHSNFIRADIIEEGVDYEKLCKRCLKVERARRKALATPARLRLGSP